jgi:hypothetical protein
MKNRRLNSYSATLLVMTLCAWIHGPVEAHEGNGKVAEESQQTAVVEQERKLVEITADYQFAVAPLIQRACADCHSGDTQYPWYSMMPGISLWIRNDIEEARRHIEFSNGYPFQSHATPLEDLIAVEKVVRDGTMPPLRYRIMHSKARLNEQEKKRIIDWARRGQRMLQNEGVARAAESTE